MPHFLTDLVASKSMTWIHCQWLPTVIVLSSIQTWVFADIFHLQWKEKKKGGGVRRVSESSERKQDEKLTSSASCSNNFSLRSAFGGCQIGTAQHPLETPSGNPPRLDRAMRFGKEGSCRWGCVILPSQSGAGWDRVWRLLGKCSSNTRRSSCSSVSSAGPSVWRHPQMPPLKTKAKKIKKNKNEQLLILFPTTVWACQVCAAALIKKGWAAKHSHQSTAADKNYLTQ